jgi:glycerophosphoryl diester phosphodiesterase
MVSQSTPRPLLSFWRDGLPATVRALPSLVVYESIWKFVALMVLGPLAVALLNALIRLSGDVAVANNDIIAFALTPLGASTLLVYATVSLTLTFVERAGLFHIFCNALHHRQTSSWRAYGRILRAGPRLLGVAFLQVCLFLLAVVPFAVVAWLTYRWLLSDADINYYLDTKPREFIVALILGGVIALACAGALTYLYVQWAFAVPAALFEHRQLVGALRASAVLVRGSGWRVFAGVGLWEVFRYGFFALVIAGLIRLNDLILDALGDGHGHMLEWVAGLMILNTFLFVAIAIVEAIGFSLVFSVFYANLHRRRAAALSVELPGLETGTGRMSRRVAFASALVMAVVLGITSWQAIGVAQEFGVRQKIEVTAHRAGARYGPENTVAALRKAIEFGADYAEIDVQRTSDGVIVVMHDNDLKRLTNVGKNIWDVKYADIKNLKIKPGAATDPTGALLEAAPLSTLEEFIATAHGKIKLNIELKYYKQHFDKGLARAVVKLLQDKGFVDQCVVTSLERAPLQEVRRLDPRIQTGYIVAMDFGDLTKVNVNSLVLERKLINAAVSRLARKHHLQIHAWTINDRKTMIAMIHLGVTNLITDDPVLAIEVRQWYNELSDVELILFNYRAWLRS